MPRSALQDDAFGRPPGTGSVLQLFHHAAGFFHLGLIAMFQYRLEHVPRRFGIAH